PTRPSALYCTPASSASDATIGVITGVGAGRASVSVAGSIGRRAYPSAPWRPCRFLGPRAILPESRSVRAPTTRRARPADAAGAPRRRAHRPVVLAARARRPRGDRVPRAGEHLHARRAGTPRVAAQRAL